MATRAELLYPDNNRDFLEPYLPAPSAGTHPQDVAVPSVTLTFATSLDSALSLAPGVQTALSGPESKAMTHYLRSRHDAIMIGVGTAIADNPSLNCRLGGVGGYGGEGLSGQPRPVVIDPQCRWQLDSTTKILNLAREGRGRAPWIITATRPDPDQESLLQDVGGTYIVLGDGLPGQQQSRLEWRDILTVIRKKDVESVMVEGGGAVINALLSPENVSLVNSFIITIAPTWLGQGGVVVSPCRPEGHHLPMARLKQTVWQQLGDDCVLCGILAT